NPEFPIPGRLLLALQGRRSSLWSQRSDYGRRRNEMQKLAVIIGGAILLVGVAAAGTFASLASGGDNPTISAKPAPRATIRLGELRREDRRADRRANRREGRATETRGRANGPGEDVPGGGAEP